MDPDVAAIIRGLETRPGASEQALATLAASLDVSLPADYLKFLQMTDGAEGPIGEEGWVDLWPTEDILDMYRQAGGAIDIAPGLVEIGSNGSSTGFAIDTRSGDPRSM